ncbi:adenylyltransferase/cytidyltransferase family protein [Maribrevibacterium harenarium]|uniref:Adenylyltransferase/cytidyltransferase family protein n=1 Tax=Maribrevibacterium harenarium TaxID=2589817 RepID=A0A501WZU1_9GAMM|nr:adenylyltransferase/cytidyltransferase family protein [Maribrevibacterium harenarium]TPE53337.1 adenylyltransferase/cytidyltransferase family protein [Maribrevibacterium harenarium]
MSPVDQLSRAIKYFHSGQYGEAKVLLEQVRSDAPELVMAQVYLAQIGILAGEGERWVAPLQELAMQLPHSHEVYHVLGQCLQQAKQLPQAATAFHTALALVAIQVEQGWQPSPKQEEPVAPFSQEQGEALLWQTLALLKSQGVYGFACSGTLLGLEREGRLLANDKDLDIGVDWLQMEQATQVLSANGWREASRSYDLINPRCFKHDVTGITLDVCGFGTDSVSGEAICGLWMDGVPFHWNRITYFPNIALSARGTPAGEVWHLTQPESMLAALYGDNWRIPDGDFDTIVCAHNLRQFSWLSYCYAYSRLYGQWLRGNTAKAMRILQVLRQQRPQDSVLSQIQQQLETSLLVERQERVLALGYFDLLHEGHLNYLQFARQLGGTLVVGIAPDRFCQQSKGYSPILNENQRCTLINALGMVDETHLVAAPMAQTDDAVAWIRSLAIHKVVCGEEWQGSERWQKLEAALAPFEIEVIYAPKTEGISTTLLKQRILQNS